jgi:eukaryotic-like serine/threonine-protein kinase
MNESADRSESIFAAAVALPSAAARTAFLLTACAGDAVLQARIEALLRAHDRAGHLLDRPVPGGHNLTQALPTAEHPGTLIAGRYKLLEAIGEGGMGSVWVAEQSQPVKRKVALKLIKAGMDSKSVLARFEAERQALAVMDHPNIAKVLDGGLTEQGRPYFVMEYVKGIPITEYCDSRQLSVPERLQLFAQVCQAVQHAHQKGIIHRDLKPSNILVAPYDDKAVPKVIDFGLAKAMHQSLTENTLHTAHDMVLGTPLYMSPEQAQLNNIDIDTRSDVYSLGVLLYELLTGSTPLEKQRFKQAAWDEMRRMIREEDPPRPSLRLSSAETLPAVAAGRHTEPERLTRLVRGELDWIVMKALEKDRTRRYETANGFAADVLRYLSGEPVLAAPPSASYRFQKFVRRNKGKVIASGLILLALLAGMAGTSWQWYRAEYSLAAEAIQRKKAEDNERTAEAARAEAVAQQTRAQQQEAEAKKQAEIAEAVAKFQTDMLAAVDPNQLPKDPVTKEPMKDAVTVVQALEAAVKVLDEGNLKDQPLVEANVRNTIGNTLKNLARYDDAEPNLRKSLEILSAVLPTGDPNIATGLNNLANLLQAQNKLAEAEPLYREALEIKRKAFPSGHPSIAAGLNNLASILRAQNKLPEAEPLLRDALEIRRGAFPAEHPDIAEGLNNLAVLLKDQNKLAEAEPLLREALEILRAAHPAGHPQIATGLGNLAVLLLAQNKLAEAEPLLREALEIRRAAHPAEHPEIATGLNNLAKLLQDQNKLGEAEPLFREAFEINHKALPAGHPAIALSLANLGKLMLDQNKLTEAEPLLREALEIARRALPADHPNMLIFIGHMGSLLRAQKKYQEAIDLLAPIEATTRKAFTGSVARRLATLLTTLGRARIGLGYDAERVKLAEANLLEAHPLFVQTRGETHKETRECSEGLVELYTAWNAAEPDQGYAAKAAQWQQKLNEHNAALATEKPATTPDK